MISPARTELDDFGITRKHPPLQDAREAFANLKPSDFDLRTEAASKEDITEIAREIANLCGMDWETCCLQDSRIRIKADARYVLHNVSMCEAQTAIEELRKDAKSLAWWRKNGRPGAVARCIVDEVSRMRTAQSVKNKTAPAWLDFTETPAQAARRVRAALSWVDK